jgi:hypothetical protein
MATPKRKQPTPAAKSVIDAPHVPPAARPTRSYAGGKVTVCSKLPFALELQLCEPTQVQMRYKQEAWFEQVFAKTGPVVVIQGTNYPIGAPPEGVVWPERPTMAGGYALTFGVDADFFEVWLEQNKTTDMVKNKMIFAQEKVDDAKAEAVENKSRDSGFGPLRPDNDKRMPKKTRVNPMSRPAEDALLADA